MRLLSIIGIIGILFLTSCSIDVKINDKSETDMGSHHVIVKPHSTITSSSSSSSENIETYRYICGDVTVVIEIEQLIVNNTRYGELSQDVDIFIDHGTVFIGGVKCEGTLMTPKENMSNIQIKESSI